MNPRPLNREIERELRTVVLPLVPTLGLQEVVQAFTFSGIGLLPSQWTEHEQKAALYTLDSLAQLKALQEPTNEPQHPRNG